MSPATTGAMPPARTVARAAVIAAMLGVAVAALAFAIYSGVGGHSFVAYDDPRYVAANPIVARGLSKAGIVWAFTALHASNWHPLTWVSHMLDVELFGMDAGWHHRVNVLLHAANGALLFWWLLRATGSRFRSALVAALFVAHPLHVESVAWVAERKDVLSTAFFLITLHAYLGWTRRPTLLREATVLAAFAAGLLAKPMLVTVPAVLLAVDFWPLRRMESRTSARRSLVEKAPFFVLSALSAAMTILAQDRGGAIASSDTLPWAARAGNALVSYAVYLWQTVWPAHLAVFYPHRGAALPAWQVVASAVVLASITALVVWQRRRRPFLAFGWSWYLVTLLPVIGLLQVGLQARADRYTYIPLVGIFIAAAWSIPELGGVRRAAAAAGCAAALLLLGAVARGQVAVWRDSTTLFTHAIAHVPDNWLALKNLGVEQFKAGDGAGALRSFEAAVRLRPQDPDLWADVGTTRVLLGDPAGAAPALERAVALNPRDAETWFNLAAVDALLGRTVPLAAARERLRALDPERARVLDDRLRERPQAVR